jgi:hypothetical protein
MEVRQHNCLFRKINFGDYPYAVAVGMNVLGVGVGDLQW